MDAWVVVSRPDGSSERHRIEGEQATVGRSPTAGVALVNAEDLQPEHLLLAPRPDGCWVAIAKGAQPAATVRGRIIEGEMLPWGTEVQVGETTIRITDKMTDDRKPGDKGVSSPVLVIAFVAIPLVGWMLLSDEEGDLPLDPGAPAPELFSDIAPCPDRGDEALHRATEAAEAASHRSERYPFDAQDGVQAVELYAVAQACYQTAGRASDSRRIRRDRDALVRRINEDYRTHRLRLERALLHEHFPDALVEAKELNQLLRHKEGDPYAAWLELLERQLQLRVDQALAASQ